MIEYNTFLYAFSLVLAIFGMEERIHLDQLVIKSNQIMVGETQGDVLRVLGEPRWRWPARRGFAIIFGRRPAQWLYGTTLDVSRMVVPDTLIPNPLPINLRLFSAELDDLVIDWTDDKRVAGVKRPELHVPDDLRGIFGTVYALADLAAAVIRSHD